MKKLILTTSLLLLSIITFGQTTAVYDIVFTSNWEAHGPLPGSNAHFTELVGATHNSNITFLKMGELATPGIEGVAETGSNGTFNSEVNSAINANNADQYIEGPDLFFNGSGRTITISDLTVSSDFPLVSLASMLAPSPDWMIAVNSVSLVDNGGQWIPEITLDLFPYDAGTEEGTGYQLNNPETVPQEPISDIRGMYTFTTEKVGTIVFTQKILNVDSFQDKENKIIVSPNPSNGNISILASKSSPIEDIEVYNILGKQVRHYNFKQNISSINLNLTSLDTGIYLLKIYNSTGKTTTQKLILN
ncbi:spondin domain-containing protein [Aquimarina sp. RZ0]|uniref:T9SS type A sorting domain-containing protein n=1 Tax=Aquimarina sp. RZ0 TaxID=2607730 RepID=UPI0011F2E1C0|nr:spondin domain-containing protein [Aquimarina sp. RZ0]KAA1243932.1 T9SS type A sorting domain-containing protein [Aquimarina sp. RZ0]